MPQDLINQAQSILNSIVSVLQIIATFLVAFLVVLWLTLCFWTFRDIQSRTRDIVAQIFATLLVVFFNIPGVLLYVLVRPKQTLTQVYEATLQEEYMLQDLEEREICPTCRVKTQPDFLYCYNCRTRLRRECPSCGQIVKLKWANCPFCGSSQKPPSREAALERFGLAAGRPPVRSTPTSTAIVRDSYQDTALDPTSAAPGATRSSSTPKFRAPSLRAGYADAGQNDFEDIQREKLTRDFDEEETYQEETELNPSLEGNGRNDVTKQDHTRFMPRKQRDTEEF